MSEITLGFRRQSLSLAQLEDLDQEILKLAANLKLQGIEPGIETIRRRVGRGANIVRQRVDYLIEQDRWPHKRMRRHDPDGREIKPTTKTEATTTKLRRAAKSATARKAKTPTTTRDDNPHAFADDARRIRNLRLANRRKLKEIGGTKS